MNKNYILRTDTSQWLNSTKTTNDQSSLVYYEGDKFNIVLELIQPSASSTLTNTEYESIWAADSKVTFALGNITTDGIKSVYCTASLVPTGSHWYSGSLFVTGSALYIGISGSQVINSLLEVEYRSPATGTPTDIITYYHDTARIYANITA